MYPLGKLPFAPSVKGMEYSVAVGITIMDLLAEVNKKVDFAVDGLDQSVVDLETRVQQVELVQGTRGESKVR